MKTQAISWMRGRAARYAGMVAGVSRRRSRSRVLTAAAAGMILAVGVFASPAAASASTPSITLKPTSGPPTAKVSVTGAGFGTSETVTVTDFGLSQSAVTSSTGTFTATFTVPKTAPSGKYPVTATGQTSHLSATAYFLVRTNWPQIRFGATGTGYNPYENVLSTSNVGTLTKKWQSSINGAYLSNSPPAAYNGALYTSSGLAGTVLDAFSPSNGALLWRGASVTGNGAWSVDTPAVVSGVAYIAASDGNLYAYSAKASSANCTGTPPDETCQPLWTAHINGTGPVVVSGGIAYMAGGYYFYAFSAKGCRAATCSPLWTAAVNSFSYTGAPAVANGVVYAGRGDGLLAYSANGTTECTGGTPDVCSPLWRGDDTTMGLNSAGSDSAAVAGGVVYTTATNGVIAFSAKGCGTATCSPLWGYVDPSSWTGFTAPAVANGTVYANASNPYTGDALYAFSTSGTKLWTAPLPDGYGGSVAAVTVANGVAYAGDTGDVEAYSASSGTPLWTLAGPNGSYGAWDTPVVVNGVLYATEANGTPFSAYKLKP